MTAPARSTAVVTVEPPAQPYALTSPIARILETDQAKAAIIPLLPQGVDWQHAIIEVHRAATVEPKILGCTPESIIMAVGLALETGLKIGKTIHLVPVNTKVSDNKYEQRLQAWTDYKGDIELVMRSGAARFVDAHAVYSGDEFSYELGDTPWVKHRPQFDTSKRGALIGAYCIASIDGYGKIKKITVMPLADIEKVRAKSKQWSTDKVKECPPWYAIKTAVHLNCKALPKNPRLAAVLKLFEHQESMESDELDPANRVEAGQQLPAIAPGSDSSLNREEQKREPAPVEHTTAWAMALPFPFNKGTPNHGKPMGEFSTDELVTIGENIVAKQKGKGNATWHDDTLRAVHLILAEQERVTSAKLAAGDDDDLPF